MNASWNNIINMYKKSLCDENEFTLGSVANAVAVARLEDDWWFFISFSIAICGKGEPALSGGHVTTSTRMHVSSCGAQERDTDTYG